MQRLEEKLNELFVKKAPVQLPENGKKTLVQYMPWITLIGGVFSALAALGLYQLVMAASAWTSYANEISIAYGSGPITNSLYTPGLWGGLLILLLEAIFFFVAFGPLKAHQKKGWNLLFWVAIVNAVYSIVHLLIDMNIVSLIFSLIGSALGLYILFQIRSYYTGAATVKTTKTTTMPTPSSTSSTK